ncbi:TPA: type 4b pilus protein PilO2 [Burkholderia ambifaria]
MLTIVTLPDSSARFALGLTWEHEPVKPKPAAVRERARRLGRFGVVRHTATGVYQVGYGELPPGTKRASRIRALASLAAEQYPSPWMGVFKLTDDAYWLIAVRDGEIVPGGDHFGDRDEVIAARNSLRAQESWHEHDGTVVQLAEIVGLATPERGLRDLQAAVPQVVWAVSAAVAATAVGVTAALWLAHEHEAQRLAELQRKADARRAQREADAAIPPWTKLPAPSALLSACASAWHDQELARHGWTIAAWRCEPQGETLSLTVNWTRAGGSALDAPGVLVDADHSQESITRPATWSLSSAPAVLADLARRTILTFSQTHDVPLTLEPPPKPDTSGKTGDVEVLPWQASEAAFTSDAPLWARYGADLDAVPGLRLASVGYEVDKSAWSAKGTLYAWTKLPAAPATPRPLPVPAGAKA